MLEKWRQDQQESQGLNDKKELCEAKFIKEPDLNKDGLKQGFLRNIASIDFESAEDTKKIKNRN